MNPLLMFSAGILAGATAVRLLKGEGAGVMSGVLWGVFVGVGVWGWGGVYVCDDCEYMTGSMCYFESMLCMLNHLHVLDLSRLASILNFFYHNVVTLLILA